MTISIDTTFDNVRLLRNLKEREKKHKDPVVSPFIDANNWPKTMESLEDYLRGNIGVIGVLLSYVMIFKEGLSFLVS